MFGITLLPSQVSNRMCKNNKLHNKTNKAGHIHECEFEKPILCKHCSPQVTFINVLNCRRIIVKSTKALTEYKTRYRDGKKCDATFYPRPRHVQDRRELMKKTNYPKRKKSCGFSFHPHISHDRNQGSRQAGSVLNYQEFQVFNFKRTGETVAD